MLVLIGIVPANFVLDTNSTTYQIERTRDAATHLSAFYHRNEATLGDYLALKRGGGIGPAAQLPLRSRTDAAHHRRAAGRPAGCEPLRRPAGRQAHRRAPLPALPGRHGQKVARLKELPARERADLQRLRTDLTATTEYAPFWVIVAVALALGAGTMVGWRRVVLTVGEKIGKQGMTYAQGMSAQVTAMGAIGLANVFSLPVSTTHVLSSGIAGTMIANKSGLQGGTVRNILLAWVLTLPASMLLAAGLFWVGVRIAG